MTNRGPNAEWRFGDLREMIPPPVWPLFPEEPLPRQLRGHRPRNEDPRVACYRNLLSAVFSEPPRLASSRDRYARAWEREHRTQGGTGEKRVVLLTVVR